MRALDVGSTTPAGAEPAAAGTATAPGAGANGAALLTPDDVVPALRANGLDVQTEGDPAFDVTFRTTRHTFKVDGTHLNLYVYGGKPGVKIGEDGAFVSSGRSASSIDYVARPHLFQTGNVIAVVVSDDEDASRRVLLALETLVAPRPIPCDDVTSCAGAVQVKGTSYAAADPHDWQIDEKDVGPPLGRIERTLVPLRPPYILFTVNGVPPDVLLVARTNEGWTPFLGPGAHDRRKFAEYACPFVAEAARSQYCPDATH
ncbi:MAG: hypothetical protein IMW98_05065 [Firmicutes bacterium]|nr:hypothetical protein [Bacillota bacterium]